MAQGQQIMAFTSIPTSLIIIFPEMSFLPMALPMIMASIFSPIRNTISSVVILLVPGELAQAITEFICKPMLRIIILPIPLLLLMGATAIMVYIWCLRSITWWRTLPYKQMEVAE